MLNITTETITPEKAQVYLNMSGGNRNISQAVVTQYAKDMKNGNWKLNGDSIRFDVNNHMIDGHHRCHACIKAGVPFQTIVTRGIDSDVFTTIDCGRHRTLGQIIGIMGYSNYQEAASVMNVAYRLINGYFIGERNHLTGQSKKSHHEMAEFFKTDPDGFVEAATIARFYSRKAKLLQTGIIGGVYYFLIKIGGYSSKYVCEFLDELMSYDSSNYSGINLLRKRLIMNATSKTNRMRNVYLFALLIKVWNSYATQTPMKTLRFNEEKEDYPQFILNKDFISNKQLKN